MELDYTTDLPSPVPSKELARMGHPGYSDSFASLVLRFAAHNGGNLFLSIQTVYGIVGRR